jgi:aubergine-like protein
VILAKTISNEKRVSSVAQKVALQLNCKLGGELWTCPHPWKDLMVLGVDVYHEKNRKANSVAGVVGTMNPELSRYFSRAIIQKEGQEIVDSLKSAFLDCLVAYHRTNGNFPQQIVVFRDGVGDGQMDATRDYEAKAIYDAFKHINVARRGGGSSPSERPVGADRPDVLRSAELDTSVASSAGHSTSFEAEDIGAEELRRVLALRPDNYDPGLCYVVVQKRINTRIYSVTGPPREARVSNPPCGTVLDKAVTRRKYKDFYLVPMSVNQGTVNPTHFVVVKETSNLALDADCIQRLAYKLTHMYFNWPGTVRVPAPCQYAHKLVELVGEHIKKQPHGSLSNKLFYL